MISVLFWTMLGFWLGAIPFSVWIGRLFLQTDIRRHGDGNPGATNAWRAAGWRVGIPTLLLDYLKGAVPVGLAHFGAGVSGWGLVVVALAPVLGHAYSPLLRGRGGKALASTFGIWTGLTLAEGSLVLGLLLGLFIILQTNDGWAVILGFLFFLGYLGLRQADGFILAVGTANALLVAWKYRLYLQSPPRLRPRLLTVLRRTIE